MFAVGAVGIQAVGAGRDSSLSVQGSDIKGGADVVLKAEGDLRLVGAANTSELHRQSSSKSGAIGVVASVNSQGGTLGITANASAARGMAEGSDLSWSNTHVSAGNTLHLESGQDTLLKGAVVSAPQISARVGGDLKLESLQDTSTYRSKDQSIGGSVTVGYGSASGSVSVSQQKIRSDFASVREQSGMQAGARGFQVEVGGTTALKGAVIASSDAAVSGGQNTFSTGGPLTLENVHNQANYQGSAYGVSLGVGTGQDGKLKAQGSGVGFGQMSGNASSTTTAGISGLAGDVGVRTGDKSQGLSTIFDATRVSKDLGAQVAITKQFGQEAPKAIATYADTQIKTLSSQLSEAPDDQKAAIQSELSKWAEGGSYRVALHTLSGALAGGMAGALGAQVAAEAAPTLNKLQDHITDTLITQGLNETAARIAGQFIAQGTATGMGAVASGGNLAGAGMAFDVDANNRALHDTEKQRIKALARDFAKQLNGGKTPTQGEIDNANDRLVAAACAMVRCADGVPKDDPAYAQFKALQGIGQSLAAEQSLLAKQYGQVGRTLNQQLFQYNEIGNGISDAWSQNKVGERLLGAAQAAVGAATMIGGTGMVTVGAVSCAETFGAGCALAAGGAGTVGYGYDNLQAGSKTAATGNATLTVGEQVLQSFGLSPGASSVLYGAMGLSPPAPEACLLNKYVGSASAANAAAKGTYAGAGGARGVITDTIGTKGGGTALADTQAALTQQVGDLRAALTG